MEIRFRTNAEYDEYKKTYYPLMVKNGFPWQLFPELSIACELKYDGWKDGINTNREHYNLDSRPDIEGAQPKIYTAILTEEEWIAAGGTKESFINVRKAKTSSLIHEIMHHIHITYFGEDNSLIWKKAAALTGLTLDFGSKTSGDYWYKPVYEDIANYFENVIEGRKENEPFLQFLRELIGIKFVKVTPAEYKIIEDKTYLPVRSIAEKFKANVEWLDETKEVYITKF